MIEINIDQEYVDPGIIVTYYDVNSGHDMTISLPNSDGTWIPSVGALVITVDGVTKSTPNFMPSAPGHVVVGFQYTDPYGKVGNYTHDVFVNDRTGTCFINLIGPSNYDWPIGNAYADPGYTLVDHTKPDAVASTTSTVNSNVVGNYSFTYSYTSSSGYQAHVTRNVRVKSGLGLHVTSIPTAIVRKNYTATDILSLITSISFISSSGGRVDSAKSAYRLGALTYAVIGNEVTFTLTDMWGIHATSISTISHPNTDIVDKSFSYESTQYSGQMPYGQGSNPVYSRDASIVGNSEVFDVDNIIQNVYGIIFTGKGERIYRPDFGCTINAVPFSLMTTYTEGEIVEALKTDIERWEPRCVVDIARTRVMKSNRAVDIDLAILVPGGHSRTLQLSYSD